MKEYVVEYADERDSCSRIARTEILHGKRELEEKIKALMEGMNFAILEVYQRENGEQTWKLKRWYSKKRLL